MSVLNSELDFNTAPDHVRRAFLHLRPQKRLLFPHHKLYKFTEHPLFQSDGSVTEWWFSVKPVAAADPGLDGTLERARRLDVRADQFARARAAVTRQWNRMNHLLRVRLRCPVYGFVGRCAAQPIDERDGFQNVLLIGGAYQFWIPNLTRQNIELISAKAADPMPR